MTANSFPMYWAKDEKWYRINYELDCFELTDEAPEKARRSFDAYKELNKEKYKRVLA